MFLDQNFMSLRLASKLVEKTMVSSLGDFVYMEIWTGLGGLETPFLEQRNVGLETRSLVLAVAYDLDLLEALKSSHDCGLCGGFKIGKNG
jgi:hypothetical protein